MCSAEFTLQTEFTVHSAGLSVNSAGLSAKSTGWGFHCSNFESNGFRPVFTEFYRIWPIFLKNGGIRGSRFFSLRRFFKHYSALHGLTRPNYHTRSDFCLLDGTRPPYTISLLGWVTPRCTQLLIWPYPITLPGRVPFNWPHPKTSSSASHLDLGILLVDNASR
jgi:hypothetical protein